MSARDTPGSADLGVHSAAVEEKGEKEEDSHARMAAENTNSTRKNFGQLQMNERNCLCSVRFEFKRLVQVTSNKGGLSK